MASEGNDATARAPTGDDVAYELLVVGKHGFSSTPVPADGELVIGRSRGADVLVDDAAVSRQHARLIARGGAFELVDLGSANGTRVRGAAIASRRAVELMPGESFQLGEHVLVLQARRAERKARHVWGFEYFEARLTEQCERALRDGAAPFHVVRVQVAPATRAQAIELIAGELSPADVIAEVAAGAWAILLVDVAAAEVEDLARRIARASRALDADVKMIGFPRDARSAPALIAAIAGAPPSASGDALADVASLSPVMIALHKQLVPIARGDINVLVLGETGVGKDVLARSIHDRSARRAKPFLRLNCAALSESLLESELFGHEKGAFTGAVASKPGLFESADGGTVFLDEIGEFPARLQPKLLQVLESHEVMRVGSVKPRAIDARFVAATNRDLEREIHAGRFRSDLYFRLAGFTVVVPPLRERKDDVLPLADELARRAAQRIGLGRAPHFRDDAAALLRAYAWPGNVRELRNVVERAVALCDGRAITPEHLPVEKMRSVVLVDDRRDRHAGGDAGAGSDGDTGDTPPIVDLSDDERAQRDRILDALARCGGNQSKTAELLGWSRSTLLNRLDALRIRRPRKRPR